MICRISGTLKSMSGLNAVIQLPFAGGAEICHEVLIPAFLSEQLGRRIGERIELVTLEYLESQNQGASFVPRLLGFMTNQERDFFDLLTTVKGIGNRKALRAMAVEPGRIAAWIAAKEAKSLTKLPEIGARLAETMIAELHGKVDGYLGQSEVRSLDAAVGSLGRTAGRLPPEAEEAVRVLVALGESQVDAERQVAQALERAQRDRLTPRTADEVVALVYGQP